MQYIPARWAAFADLRHTIDQQFVAGDVVPTIATPRGTQRGMLLGPPPTGQEVSFAGDRLFQVSDSSHGSNH